MLSTLQEEQIEEEEFVLRQGFTRQKHQSLFVKQTIIIAFCQMLPLKAWIHVKCVDQYSSHN